MTRIFPSRHPYLKWNQAFLASIAGIKRPRRLLAVILILFSLSLMTHGKNSGQGDEPHYMMIADSIWFDHDLDLENNYANKTNLVFAGNLTPDMHTRRGRENKLYSVHPIGLPLLALPEFGIAYATANALPETLLSRLRLTKWTLMRQILSTFMLLLTAWLAILINDYLISTLAIRKEFAFLTVLISFLSCPLLPMGFLFFTELPAAFLGFVGFGFRRPTRSAAILRASAIAFLPFLHVKYLVLSFALLAFLIWEFWQEGNRLKVFLAAGLYASGQTILAVINYNCWGSILPYASFGSVLVSETMWGQGILGLFLDQEFGLVWIAPLYLFSIAGLVVLWKRGMQMELIRVSILIGSLLIVFANFPMWWGGWSPSARFLAPAVVFLIPLVAISLQVYWNNGALSLLMKSLILYQFLLAFYLWQHPKQMWNHADGKSELFAMVNGFLPSVIALGEKNIALCAIWSFVIAVVLIAQIKSIRAASSLELSRKFSG